MIHKRIDVSEQDEITTFRLTDSELSDLVIQDELHDELISFVESHRPPKLLVDFGVVNYCTTGIINSLLSTKRRVAAYGGQFKLCCLTKHVDDAFKALNLKGTVFEVYDTVDEARAAFSN